MQQTAQTDVRGSQRKFAFDFLKAVATDPHLDGKNLIFSPASVFSAAQVFSECLSERDRARVWERLSLQWSSEDDVRMASASFKQNSEIMTEAAQVVTANSIWVKPDVTVPAKVKETCEQFYEADVLPFLDRSAPDDWCNKRTRGMITRVPVQEIYDALILNAVYFKALWKDSFEPSRTRPGVFNSSSGGRTPCNLMSQNGTINYANNGSALAIELPYKHPKLSFIAAMPLKTGIEQFVSGLSSDVWNSMSSALAPTSVNLFLPKMKYGCNIDLKPILRKLGLDFIFETQIEQLRDRTGRPVTLQAAIQEAVVELDEDGTKAAAVTAMSMRCGSLGSSIDVTFDRPFVYAIVDNVLQMPLFFGIVRGDRF